MVNCDLSLTLTPVIGALDLFPMILFQHRLTCRYKQNGRFLLFYHATIIYRNHRGNVVYLPEFSNSRISNVNRHNKITKQNPLTLTLSITAF